MSAMNHKHKRWQVGLILLMSGAALLTLMNQSVAAQARTHRELVKMFEYDRTAPLEVKESPLEEKDNAKVYDITYASPSGGRATAFLVTPLTKGRHPALLFAHPAGGSRKDFLPEALLFATAGVVSLLVDDPSARPAEWRRQIFTFTEPENARAAYIQAIIDLRRGVDLLAARPEVDAKRLGFVGFSFGATLGGILCGVERRIKAYALMGTAARLSEFWRTGELPNLVRLRASLSKEQLGKYIEATAAFDVAHYISHAAPAAVLFQFGRRDANVPEKFALELYRLGRRPKAINWWDGAHELNPEATLARAAWFHAQLGSGQLDLRQERR